jgi:hypothetical protein
MPYGRAFDQPAVYQIRVKGTLAPIWSDWFDGVRIIPQPDDETLLVGSVLDQPALHGMLAQIRNLGLPLLTVVRLGPLDERENTCDRDGDSY